MDLRLLILSLIEGLTEFLPISSTAHLILVSKLTSIDLTSSYIKFYLLFIQFGALLAGVSVFAKRVFRDKKILINIFISFIPSAILGFVFYKMFKQLLEGNILLLLLALSLGGVVFIYLEKVYMVRNTEKEKDFGKEEINKMDAFILGLSQVIAIVPGVSRSGATIVAGILRGIKKSVVFEYTFILALPTLGVAVLYDAYKSREVLSAITSYNELILGFFVSYVVATITLYVLRKYLSNLSLTMFGWYRIILALVVIFFIA